MTRSPDAGSAALRVLTLVVLYSLPAVVTLRPVGDPVFDPDIWWHLRTGQWVVEHRAVPDLEPFSQVRKPWVAYSWLYEVGVYALYTNLGLLGVVIYRVILALAITLALHHFVARREPRFLVATGLTAVALLAVAMLFSERPWLFTILFSILTLSAVLDLREGRVSWLVPLLPLVFVLWANIHVQFVYGLGLLGLACVSPLLDRRLGLSPQRITPPDEGDPPPTAADAWSPAGRRLVLLAGVCCLATLVNPYGVRIYQVVVEYATQPGPFRFVNELKALEFREPCDWVMLALAAAATFSLGRHRRLSSFDVLLLAGAAVLAFRARRDLWLLVLASLAVLTSPRSPAEPAGPRWGLSRVHYAAVAIGLLPVIGMTAWWRGLSPERLDAKVAQVFPVGAAHYVAARGDLAGPLLNDFNWGGYLIWALPGRPVAIDGRTNLHGDERIQRMGNAWAGLPGWDSDPFVAEAGVAIAPAQSPLAALLASDRRFACVYQDDVARVFVNRGATLPEARTDLARSRLHAQPLPRRHERLSPPR